ncbi:SPX domain, Zinc finger, RING/FYVE/PHD-type [Artemisia annua]|uniref:RING-type E3 ubiquitin transferase n=1 Tax=Artemisia annua TaxID=35608 RepID=A0A2U1KT16_ARTAN|nr:SPX domain, Zinc finger, RING/FYVE/PHD-type [Artemisia annua]
MGFEKKFLAYLAGDEVKDVGNKFHFDYTRLKNGLNYCRNRRLNDGSIDPHDDAKMKDGLDQNIIPQQSCQRCDWMFSELTTQASKMADIFSSRVRELVHLHFSPTMPRFLSCLFRCFNDDQEALVHKALILIKFAVMNAIALRKILKKYDKVHECGSGMNYKSKLQAKHLDIMQSPWFIELVALYINVNGSDSLMSDELFGPLTFDLSMTDEESVLTLTLLSSEKYGCSFTCPICLDILFQPYALSCRHIFCKSCACLAARVLIIDGFKYASPESNCPVCRESGVYAKSVRMPEIGLLLQRRCKQEFNERLIEERNKILKQTKEYWELQASYVIGL